MSLVSQWSISLVNSVQLFMSLISWNFPRFVKIIHHLEIIHKHRFNPLRDPNKGHASPFNNYFNCSVATNRLLVEETAHTLTNGYYAAKHLWSVVNELITFSSNLIRSFSFCYICYMCQSLSILLEVYSFNLHQGQFYPLFTYHF